MKKQKDRYLINRVMYKNIKKYDHQQMEEFLTDVYKNGYQDGRESVPGIELEDVKSALRGTKGIDRSCGNVSQNAWPIFSERRNHNGKEKDVAGI